MLGSVTDAMQNFMRRSFGQLGVATARRQRGHEKGDGEHLASDPLRGHVKLPAGQNQRLNTADTNGRDFKKLHRIRAGRHLFREAVQENTMRIRLPGTIKADLPFSDAVWAGNTLYLSGHIGLDPETSKPPTQASTEARLVLDAMQNTLAAAGLRMSDLVSLQIFCSDVGLFSEFNAVYRTYFADGEYPARAFLGSGRLLFDARFEVQGIAVKSA
jgi:reactive intermediate/imine deaminase